MAPLISTSAQQRRTGRKQTGSRSRWDARGSRFSDSTDPKQHSSTKAGQPRTSRRSADEGPPFHERAAMAKTRMRRAHTQRTPIGFPASDESQRMYDEA